MGNYSGVGVLGGIVGGLSAGQEQTKAHLAPAPAVDREINGEMIALNAATDELARYISELDGRLEPVLLTIPGAAGADNKLNESCSSPLGRGISEKAGALRGLTRQVQSILDRLAV